MPMKTGSADVASTRTVAKLSPNQPGTSSRSRFSDASACPLLEKACVSELR
jgi:hypothetical protein